MSAKINSTSRNEAISNVKDLTGSAMNVSQKSAQISSVAAVASLVFLATLHVLSPEFDPSWRMVSEYALGNYGWVLSLMFIAWAVSSWALAFTIWSQARTRAGKIGLIFLIAAGVGEAMASAFDINHPLHSVAAMIGILSLPVAAMLISINLGRTEAWSPARKALLWTANLTWVSVLLMAGTFILLIVTYTQAGGEMTSEVAALPPGVIALVGWANRFLIIAYCVWVITLARHAVTKPESRSL
jgi:hypothetical membrane protein